MDDMNTFLILTATIQQVHWMGRVRAPYNPCRLASRAKRWGVVEKLRQCWDNELTWYRRGKPLLKHKEVGPLNKKETPRLA